MAELVYTAESLAPILENPESLAALKRLRQIVREGAAPEECLGEALMMGVAELPHEPPREPVTGMFSHLVAGENEAAFNLVELLVNTIRRRTEKEVHHFGLWGPASTGKTTTAQIIAQHLDRPIFVGDAGFFNGYGSERLLDAITQAHLGTHAKQEDYHHVYMNFYETPMLDRLCMYVAPTVVFIDEAHELSPAFQNALLTVMEKPYRFFAHGREVDCRDVTIILATTDSSQILKPLRSRCHEVSFESYSLSTVAEIVGRSSGIYGTLANRVALAARLIPRRAIQIAKTLDPSNPAHTLDTVYAVDEDGMDRRDRRIIEVLSNNTKQVDAIQRETAERIVQRAAEGARVGAVTLARAEAIVASQGTAQPMGLATLADQVGVSDLRELAERVNSLVSRGYLRRTPRGVVFAQEGFNTFYEGK